MLASLFRRPAASTLGAGVRAFGTSSPRSFARITIIGHLADSPELQPTSTARQPLKYAIASNHGPKDNRMTSWFRVTAFEEAGPRRDFLLSLPKGSLVYVEGEASMSTYTDNENKTRTSLNIVQRTMEVLKRPQIEPSPDSNE